MYAPKYTITNLILRNIGVIEAAREVIDNAPLLPYYEKEFQKDAMVRAVHHGTHIEGNELNIDQAEKVIQGEDVVGRPRDIQEVINYRKVMEYIGEIREVEAKHEFQIEPLFIKYLHKLTVDRILDPEKCGTYRNTQVVVKNSLTGQVTFTPPLAIAVPIQLEDLLKFMNHARAETIHPVLKSGVVHYEFVRIHPFVDGNGRVGRALSTFILFQEGYDIRKFFSLEEYFDKEANNYYMALQSIERNDGDLTEWLEYYTEGLSIELNKIKEKIEKISVDGNLKQRLGGAPILLSDRQIKLIEYIQKAGFLQNKAFASIFPMVSEDTVLNELKSLIKQGIVKKTGATKAARYVMA